MLGSDLLALFPVGTCQCAGHRILITCAPPLPALHEDTGTGRHYSGLREMKTIRFGSGPGVAGAHPRQSLLEVEKIPPIFVSHRLPLD